MRFFGLAGIVCASIFGEPCKDGDPLVPGSTPGQDVKHKGVA